MKVSIIGIGDMGRDIAVHVRDRGHDVTAFDISEQRRTDASGNGINVVDSLAAAVAGAELHLVIVATDEQSETVTREILGSAAKGSTIVILATNSPKTMQALAVECDAKGIGFVDAPVVFGREGARDGTLGSLCGGTNEQVAKVTPVLEAYSKDVHHVGPVGSGQVAKACNNMLHWAACVANFEVLLLAKRYGIDAQNMREILTQCPGTNGTLERWDGTRFTWHEKDMDLALTLAQDGKLPLPLFGQVDQLVKHLDAEKVKNLLYGPDADYLGQHVKPLTKEEGGLN
ncbi:MAG: NAD(P)-dependent oxidoreductase [Marinobacter sp.]|uniref:NAD(P)-dependent oxidoreductase n=1 Tax=Marinobacter sp. TaxID=50741 RepID=UPI0034A05BAF